MLECRYLLIGLQVNRSPKQRLPNLMSLLLFLVVVVSCLELRTFLRDNIQAQKLVLQRVIICTCLEDHKCTEGDATSAADHELSITFFSRSRIFEHNSPGIDKREAWVLLRTKARLGEETRDPHHV